MDYRPEHKITYKGAVKDVIYCFTIAEATHNNVHQHILCWGFMKMLHKNILFGIFIGNIFMAPPQE